MAIFRPTPKPAENTGGVKFTGICEVGIVGFTDRSSEFDWSDVYLEIEFALKNSKYTRKMQLAGGFEKDGSGNIGPGGVLDRVYRIFDAIGCEAGLNVKGEWEDNDGKPIADIAGFLNANYCSNFMPGVDPVLDYVAYVYKALNKKTGTTFNNMLVKLYPNTDKGKEEMASYVKWMRNNNYLNEATDEPKSSNPVVSADAL